MHFMVNNVQRGLQQHLIRKLYREVGRPHGFLWLWGDAVLCDLMLCAACVVGASAAVQRCQASGHAQGQTLSKSSLQFPGHCCR